MNQYYKLIAATCLALSALNAKAQCDTVSINFANVTATSAIGSWAAIPSANSYSYAILLATAPVPPANGTVTTQHSVMTQGLAADKEYKICVQTNCTSGNSAWTCGSFKTLPAGTGISSIYQTSVAIYPNPVTDVLHFNFADKATHHITIVNSLGIVVSAHVLQSGEASLNLNNLQSGLYFVKTASENNTQTFKIEKR